MKFTKTFGIFFLTFIIGCAISIPIIRASMKAETTIKYSKIDKKIEPIKVTAKPLETPKLEVIDEIENSWTEEKKSYKIQLLETGEGFHGDEVKAKSGEKWLGLFQENNKFVLKSTKLKIRRVHDGIIDYKTNNKTGKSVAISEKNEPMFLLKNSNLKSGEVISLFRGNKYGEIPENSGLSYDEFLTVINEGFVKEFEISNKKYSLKVIKALNKDDEKLLALVLEGLGKRQVLHTVQEKYNDEGLGILHWVGDLDKDGKPDFYMSPSVHYNVANRVLFLSSKAKQNNLLGKVAYFWTTGC